VTALLALLVLATAPLQVAITTSLVRDPLAAPVLPVALIAAWAAARRPEEAWPAILLPAVVLGVASEERVGWFLVALLPAPLLAAFAVRRLRPRVNGLWRRVSAACAAAAGGAVAYALVLALAGGLGGTLYDHAGPLLATGVLSALLAGVATLGFWPLRPRERGLFA
jgi:hypothetical protein